MPDDFNPTEWVTTREASELTGYTAAYFRQLIQRGRLHNAEKRGRDWFLSKDEVLAYAEKMRRLGSANTNCHSRHREFWLPHGGLRIHGLSSGNWYKYALWRTEARHRSGEAE